MGLSCVYINVRECRKYVLSISLRTEVHDVPLSDRIARVFELFFLDIPGFSGFLLLSYPVCGP